MWAHPNKQANVISTILTAALAAVWATSNSLSSMSQKVLNTSMIWSDVALAENSMASNCHPLRRFVPHSLHHCLHPPLCEEARQECCVNSCSIYFVGKLIWRQGYLGGDFFTFLVAFLRSSFSMALLAYHGWILVLLHGAARLFSEEKRLSSYSFCDVC